MVHGGVGGGGGGGGVGGGCGGGGSSAGGRLAGNNPKSIAQPKVFPLHRFEFAKLVLVSEQWNSGAHIAARTNITGGQDLQDIQQASMMM